MRQALAINRPRTRTGCEANDTDFGTSAQNSGTPPPVVYCGRPREYVPVGSMAACVPPTLPPKATGIGSRQCHSGVRPDSRHAYQRLAAHRVLDSLCVREIGREGISAVATPPESGWTTNCRGSRHARCAAPDQWRKVVAAVRATGPLPRRRLPKPGAAGAQSAGIAPAARPH